MSLKLGDRNETVRRWRAVMAARFAGYARTRGELPTDTDMFGPRAESWQLEYEQRTGQVKDGVVSDDDLIALGIPLPPRKPTLFTVHGTGVTMWDGPPADTARAVLDKYAWQPIGNYPAAPFPMWPSIQAGCAELRAQINRLPGEFNIAGYSQGAIVASLVYKYDLLPTDGALHHRLGDLKKVVTWGNPMAEAGHSYPGDRARVAGRGIMEDRLEGTPFWWWDFRNKGDIYTDCPDDGVGENYTAICKIVMGHRWWTGMDSILAQALEAVQRPYPEVVHMVRAVLGGALFFGSGTRPHVTYDIQPAVEYLRSVG